MSLEMAHKVIVPQKKIMSRSFLNSSTLIVKCGPGSNFSLYADPGPTFHLNADPYPRQHDGNLRPLETPQGSNFILQASVLSLLASTVLNLYLNSDLQLLTLMRIRCGSLGIRILKIKLCCLTCRPDGVVCGHQFEPQLHRLKAARTLQGNIQSAVLQLFLHQERNNLKFVVNLTRWSERPLLVGGLKPASLRLRSCWYSFLIWWSKSKAALCWPDHFGILSFPVMTKTIMVAFVQFYNGSKLAVYRSVKSIFSKMHPNYNIYRCSTFKHCTAYGMFLMLTNNIWIRVTRLVFIYQKICPSFISSSPREATTTSPVH